MHPSEQPIPFPLPSWSDESHNYDWVAQRPLPAFIANDAGVQTALDRYRSNRTDANLVRAVRAIRETRPKKYLRPLVELGVDTPDEYAQALEFNRWVSALIGSHALRSGNETATLRSMMDMSVDGNPVRGKETLLKEMWTVGNMFRLARSGANPNDDTGHHHVGPPESYYSHHEDFVLPAVQWFYVSWMFVHESFELPDRYLSELLGEKQGLEYKRVSAYMIAYTTAALHLGRGGAQFKVLAALAQGTPEHWQPNLVPFVLDNILHEIDQGRIVRYNHQSHMQHVKGSVNYILENNSHLTSSDRTEIKRKRDQILEYLNEQQEIYQ
jgi:hypothetical protein